MYSIQTKLLLYTIFLKHCAYRKLLKSSFYSHFTCWQHQLSRLNMGRYMHLAALYHYNLTKEVNRNSPKTSHKAIQEFTVLPHGSLAVNGFEGGLGSLSPALFSAMTLNSYSFSSIRSLAFKLVSGTRSLSAFTQRGLNEDLRST